MWSNRNKINTGQSKTLAIEGLRERDAFYSLQIYDKILDWFCPISFLVVYIVLSETHLRSSISAESFVVCCGCGASSKLSLAYLLLAHTTTTISRHFYKTLSNNKSLICKSALNFSVGAKIPFVSSKRALQNWLFKSKVNIRRSMLIRKGKLRKYHLQLVRRKVVLWSHSLLFHLLTLLQTNGFTAHIPSAMKQHFAKRESRVSLLFSVFMIYCYKCAHTFYI